MKLFNFLSNLIFKLLGLILAIIIILILGIIIKWKTDTLYLESMANKKIHFSLKDEFIKTKEDLIKLINKEEIKYEIPVVEEIKDTITITIPQGASLEDVANELINKGFIQNIEELKNQIQKIGLKTGFITGSYEFKNGVNLKNILLKLTATEEKQRSIEIFQGTSLDEIANGLLKQGIISSKEKFIEIIKASNKTINSGVYNFTTPINEEDLVNIIAQ